MADSTTATDIPPGKFDLVAGYVDGAYKWTDEDWLFHHLSRLVTITCTTTDVTAQVCDVEPGCASPQAAANWVKARHAAGQFATLYFSRSRFNEIHAALTAAGVDDSQWQVWVAEWNGVPHLVPGTYATQYADPAYGSGGHYDVSLVADYWPGIDPVPVAPPVGVPLPPGNPPADSPPPFQTSPPPVASDIDTTRSAWSNLASFLTQDLPAFVQELLRLLGLYRRTP